jgi:hypothetical protein
VTGCNYPDLRFSVGQKWVDKDPRYGTFLGEVIATSTQSEWGTIVITDDQGKVLDTYVGTVATFLASGEWQLVEV